MVNDNHSTENLPFCSKPKYLGEASNRSLRYPRHLDSLRKKLASRVALFRQFAGSGWGAGATTLQTATLAHSTTEYCDPVLCLSAHTRHNDLTINDTLRIVTGCLRHTRANNLPILVGNHPAELGRKGATLFTARLDMAPGHLLHCSCSPVHWVGMHGASNWYTHLYPPHNNSSVQLTTAYVRRSGRITDGMWSGRTTPPLRTFIY